ADCRLPIKQKKESSGMRKIPAALILCAGRRSSRSTIGHWQFPRPKIWLERMLAGCFTRG
ncbi:MAG: hypothetical protein P4L87_00895, partial [Formivibrio sp.]|nr:hypothetical protein [Formivibrio sp.]